jgi:hypothetical protein
MSANEIKEFGFYLDDAVFVWSPKENITVHELAVILPVFTSFNHVQDTKLRHELFRRWYFGLEDNFKRHFKIIKYEQ